MMITLHGILMIHSVGSFLSISFFLEFKHNFPFHGPSLLKAIGKESDED